MYCDLQRVQNVLHFYAPKLEHSMVSPLHTNLQVANFQRCERASGSIKEPEPVPATSGVSEIAACPPSPTADNPSALHLPPPLPPAISKSSCLFIRCQPLYWTTVLFKIINVFFIFCVCFLCIICVKSIINLFQYSTT